MAFDRPTLATLIARAQADIEAALPGADAHLRRTVEYALARVLAGLTHGLHGHLAWIAQQVIPDSAEAEYLERWAAIWDITRKQSAASGGDIVLTGVNGSVCPAGTVWQTASGVRYTQDAPATISSTTATTAVTAELSGTTGNLDAGTTLRLASAVVGVNASSTVDVDGIAGGTDIESDAELLARLLVRLHEQPKGGGPGDYVSWALEVAGVTRAWEYAAYLGAGTVGVTFVRDNDESIIPSAGEVSDVQDYIEQRAPITAVVTVFAPIEDVIDFTIDLTPDTPDIREAVEAQLVALFAEFSEPGGTIYRSQYIEAISLAAGEEHHSVTVPSGNIVAAAGHLATLGTIS